MTTRTFTVTVVNVSGYNKYFIDGVQQPTLTLAEGGTYVFNWSAATGHPVRFSTTSNGTHSGGTEYTTGVTKDDGNYLTTIQVADSAPTLYYYCQYHSNMGGQIDTELATTWGLLAWGQGAWGDQNDISVSVTGVASTTAVGSVTIDAEIGEGWGRGTWGNRVWNGVYSVIPTGVSATTAVGSVTPSISISVSVTGVASTTAVGSVTTTQGVSLSVTGLPITSSIGTITANGTGDVSATGLSLTGSVGSVIIAPLTIADATGVGLTSSVGTAITAFDSLIAVSGLSLTSSVGSITPISTYSVTGVSATSAVGTPAEVGGTGIVDDVTGVVLTASTSAPIIVVWSEIDTGTPITWTKITTAA